MQKLEDAVERIKRIQEREAAKAKEKAQAEGRAVTHPRYRPALSKRTAFTLQAEAIRPNPIPHVPVTGLFR